MLTAWVAVFLLVGVASVLYLLHRLFRCLGFVQDADAAVEIGSRAWSP